ncbi:alpha/beta hydrolase [Nocardioides sp. SLBN-35]|uniref:alpha/beta hydrolase n=1 Tax=Nocardioides sp. SLBN-35 TaxID=2768445 RepID=UPI00115493B6|nr:alpha/beta hydrolase [Nocardioides sp. SLBN-35]TQK68894.1 acetyl esterase/lipase [Nocardioides sp. SLBN-35]
MRLQKAAQVRGSVRSRAAAAVTARTLRPLTAVVPLNRAGIRFSRGLVAGSLAVFGPPLRGSRVVRVERPATSGPTPRGEWVRGPGAERDDAVVLYVHGSAYTICSSRTHRGLTSRLSARTGLPVFACDYRLAPSHRFPSAADDVRAAYEWLIGEGHDPARIVLAGDSAGGHLAVDLALELIREGRTSPAALVAFSPVLDLSMSLAAARERMRPDPMISASRAARMLDLYVAGHDPRAARLSFTFDGADRFPPTLVQAGGAEMLAADAIELARGLSSSGAECRLEVWPDQMHVFQALPRVVPEADRALDVAADFVDEQLEVQRRRSALTLVHPVKEA